MDVTAWRNITKTIAEHYFKKCCITNSPAENFHVWKNIDIYDSVKKKKQKKHDSEELDSEYEEVLRIYFVYIFHNGIIQLKSIFK